jgi:O-methyltransferase
MSLKRMIDRVSRGRRHGPLSEEKETTIGFAGERIACEQLARDILEAAPDRAVELLSLVKRAVTAQASEFDRYISAEALSTLIYPKYKFSEFGRLFLEDEQFLAYYRTIMDAGNWHSLDRKYTLDQMLKLVEHIEGEIAECGAYKGASALLMCRSLLGSKSLAHLFDSFEGLDEPQPVDGTYWQKGSLSVGEAALHETLRGFDNYRVYKRWIPERFPEVSDCRFRFVHIDVDLYRATLASLEFFFPRLMPGGLVLLDDYGFSSCPGAKQATDEFFADKPENIAMLPTGQAFAIKR